MVFGSVGGEFHFSNAQFSQCGYFSTRFNHKLPLYLSTVSDNHRLAIDALSINWNFLHASAFPYEPLHKASKLHVTVKTAFLLAHATAKRRSEIHALAVDANHLWFNQSVSLIVQTGFWGKESASVHLPKSYRYA